MNNSIEEMANRAIEFGDCMINHMDERHKHRETIQKIAEDRESLTDWRNAPGVCSDAAALLNEAQGLLAFTTVELIRRHPEFKEYFREQSGIPAKRIGQQIRGLRGEDRETEWVKFVNSVCSKIIKQKKEWNYTFHEYLAASSRVVSLDGTMRNRVGQEAESKVKNKLVKWLQEKNLVENKIKNNEYLLTSDITLKFASEPDIGFYRGTFLKKEKLIAIVEIKGGKDPAGALERIGALEKTMNEVPNECWCFAILGVTTKSMNERLEKLKLSDRFDLEKLLINKEGEWDKFITRVFKDALRLNYE